MPDAPSSEPARAPIQPVVVGTAGHVDHGKSSLVRALTGIDPDRLAEERERGLTIDLGFASLELPDGRRIGLVDVPGHERFVRNMVAGATGVDLALLVVAADDGVMPQTREHLDILELVGVRRGVVALNKIDAVEPELVDLAEEELREALRGSFLDGAPRVRVSAATGAGVEDLRSALVALAADTPARPAEGLFRMPIQRVFSARGFGTVVTGVPAGGEVRLGEGLEILPAGPRGAAALRGKVRGLQAYHLPTDVARAGHSTAINLSDVDHRAVRRGQVVCAPGAFAAARMLGARLRVLASAPRPVTDRMAVRLHVGTADVVGEVVLLDRRELAPGDEGLVQLRLAEPVVAVAGDRFVLRVVSPAATLGGGVVLEQSRHRLKRFKGFVIDELERTERALRSAPELLETVLARRGRELAATAELARAVQLAPAEARRLLEALGAAGRAREVGRDRWVHAECLAEGLEELRRHLDRWFEEHPHRGVVSTLELRRASGLPDDFLDALLEAEARAGRVTLEPGGQVRPAGRAGAVDAGVAATAEAVLAALEAGAFQPPSPAELAAAAGADAAGVARALELLEDQGRVRRVKDLHFTSARLSEAADAIAQNCAAHGALAIPELRDRLATSRKFLIPLLEHFDAQGLTLRQGGVRVLRRR